MVTNAIPIATPLMILPMINIVIVSRMKAKIIPIIQITDKLSIDLINPKCSDISPPITLPAINNKKHKKNMLESPIRDLQKYTYS